MKLFIVLNCQGGVPPDPEIFLDRVAAITQYVEYAKEFAALAALTCAHQTGEGNICAHEFPHPTVETFDNYFEYVTCPECREETHLGELYFYDGIEVQEQQADTGTDAAGNPSESLNETHLKRVREARDELESKEACETVRPRETEETDHGNVQKKKSLIG